MLRKLRIIFHEYMGAYRSAQKREDSSSLHYLKAAELGSLKSQNEIGVRYYEGKGVAQDFGESIKWYKLAAEQEYMYSQANLGWCYLRGEGVPKDNAIAFEWYEKAAEKGYPVSQYHAGKMYAQGIGVERDLAKAKYWLEQAIRNEITEAEGLLKEIESGT